MATPVGELYPGNDEEELLDSDVAAHIGRTEHSILLEGRIESVTDPHDFPVILDAFFINREGLGSDETTQDHSVGVAQQFLRRQSVGITISEALANLSQDEDSQILFQNLYMAQDSGTRIYRYDQIIQACAPFLPEGYTADALRNPWEYVPSQN
jgi:hypothetical protein